MIGFWSNGNIKEKVFLKSPDGSRLVILEIWNERRNIKKQNSNKKKNKEEITPFSYFKTVGIPTFLSLDRQMFCETLKLQNSK